jgi:hypothetical protein
MENSGTNDKVKPPRGLFERIMVRLGLERQLAFLRRRLDLTLVGSAFVFFLTIAALYLTIDFLLRSTFFQIARLFVDDPRLIIGHWRPYFSAVFESVPGLFTAAALFCLGLVMSLTRLASIYAGRIADLVKRKELTNKK